MAKRYEKAHIIYSSCFKCLEVKVSFTYLHICPLQVSSSSRNELVLNESNALMTSDGQNVADLSDEDLYTKLKEFGVDVGPIVGECHICFHAKIIEYFQVF